MAIPVLPALAVCVVVEVAIAQGAAVDVRLGRWGAGAGFSTFEVTIERPMLGPVALGYGVLAIVDDSSAFDDAFFGLNLDLSLFKHRSRAGVYAVAGAALGLHPFESLPTDADSSRLAISWSAGVGLEWNPLAFVGLNTEVRYRAHDRGLNGFWRLEAGALRGIELTVGGTIRWGYRRAPRTRRREPIQPPVRITGSAADVVQTTLSAMGTPYEWGGSDRNGFDCSGLIHWAYAQHGHSVPRVSRDQARTGKPVPRDVDALRPGDILAFSGVPGGQVTHVGMYVGESKFIHSAGRGVVLSLLSPSDPDGKWWWRRWVAARRVI